MNAQQLTRFFDGIDLDPEGVEGVDLPEGWRIACPSDFTFLRSDDPESEYEHTFLVEGPWATWEDFDSETGEIRDPIAGRTEWGLPDLHSTLLVFRPDEGTTEPPRPTKWPAWDRLCQ